MNEIQKSEAYKKDCMNMIFELEKEKFMQEQLVQECYKKMEDFHKKWEDKKYKYFSNARNTELSCKKIDEELEEDLRYLNNMKPEFQLGTWFGLYVIWIILWLLSSNYIKYKEFDNPAFDLLLYLLLPFILIGVLLYSPQIVRHFQCPKLSQKYRERAEKSKEALKKQNGYYDTDKLIKEIDDKIYAFDERANEEIDAISRGIDEIDKNLNTLYNMIEDFPKELRGDLGVVSAVVSYLNKVGECTHKYWRMALLDAERVVGLRKVDKRLSDFENRMVEFSSELQSEIEMMMEDYNEEINDIMDSYIEINDDLQEKQISVERRYQHNVDKANTAALKYIGEYHVY